MSRAFRSMTTALNMTLSSFEALQHASSNAIDTSSIETARRELASAELEINSIEQSLRDSQNQQDRFNRSVHNGGSAMDNLVNKARSLAGAYLGIQAIGQGIEATDTYANNTARLSLIVDEPSGDLSIQDSINAKLQTTKELQDQIYQSAMRSRGSYNDMQESVAKLGLLAGDAFNNNDEIVAFNELLQKSFKIGGTDANGASAAMLQLTQAMGAGRLQGDEFNSIMENAPMIANAIAQYLGVAKGELKEMASDGEITADIIKAAMFSASSEIEEQFSQMPMTFSDAWTQIKSTATYQAQELMQNVNSALNSSGGQAIINGITSAIGGLIFALGVVFGLVMDVSSFFSDNWLMLEPIVLGLATAFGLYAVALGIYNGVRAVSNALDAIAAVRAQVHAAALMMQSGATFAATAAQYGFNAALMACPITWIILAIIALIAIFYAAVAAVNHFAGTSISATGMICGAFSVAAAAIGNTIIGLINWVIGNGIMLYNLIASFANFFATVFNDPVAAIAQLFADLFDTICGIVQNAAGMIDALLGSNISGAVAGFRADVADFVDNKIGDRTVTVMDKLNAKDYQLDRFKYGDAYNAGYKFGQGIDKKVSGAFKFDTNQYKSMMPDYSSMGSQLGNIGEGVGNTADNTGRTADALETTEEDLKYLRDLAEQEVIDRTVFRDIKVELGGVTNNVNSNMDLDGIVDYIGTALEDAMLSSAEGAH